MRISNRALVFLTGGRRSPSGTGECWSVPKNIDNLKNTTTNKYQKLLIYNVGTYANT